MTGAILLSIAGGWVAASIVVCWFVHRATRVLCPEDPDRAPHGTALYVPDAWLIER